MQEIISRGLTMKILFDGDAIAVRHGIMNSGRLVLTNQTSRFEADDLQESITDVSQVDQVTVTIPGALFPKNTVSGIRVSDGQRSFEYGLSDMSNQEIIHAFVSECIHREDEPQRMTEEESQDGESEKRQNDRDITDSVRFAIVFRGKGYITKKALAEEYNVPPMKFYNYLNKGWTVEEALGLKQHIEPTVFFKGVQYQSERTLAESFHISFATYKSRLSLGWGQEEALGIIPHIPILASLRSRIFKANDLCPGLAYIYRTNPYCILGISALSSKKEALVEYDKLQKMNKARIQNSYKGQFDFVNVEPPCRDIGNVTLAMPNLEKKEFRWIWFSDSLYTKIWNRDVLKVFLKPEAKYEEMLVCLYHCMLVYPGYESQWIDLLSLIDSFLAKSDIDLFELIKDHVDEVDRKKYNYRMITKSFREAMKDLLIINYSGQGLQQKARFVSLLRQRKFSFSDEFIKDTATQAIEWLKQRVEVITEARDTVNSKEPNYARDDLDLLIQVITAFEEKNGFEDCESMAIALEGVELFSEVFRGKVKEIASGCLRQ